MNIIQLSQRIRSLCVKRGLTLKQVSKKTGLTNGVLSKIENFRVTPSLTTVTKIAEALEIDTIRVVRRAGGATGDGGCSQARAQDRGARPA